MVTPGADPLDVAATKADIRLREMLNPQTPPPSATLPALTAATKPAPRPPAAPTKSSAATTSTHC
jgi:hypothetical protein